MNYSKDSVAKAPCLKTTSLRISTNLARTLITRLRLNYSTIISRAIISLTSEVCHSLGQGGVDAYNGTEIPKEEWKGGSAPRPGEIVGGKMYPSCVACYTEKTPCLWEFRILQARMERLNAGEWRCEQCAVKELECSFVWGVLDPLRKMDDALNRLVRHAESDYRKTDRRHERDAAARDALAKAVAKI